MNPLIEDLTLSETNKIPTHILNKRYYDVCNTIYDKRYNFGREFEIM